MPIYEYLCANCGRVFEQLVLSRDVVVACPRCPGAAVEKQFSAFRVSGEHAIAGSGMTGGGGGGCAPSG